MVLDLTGIKSVNKEAVIQYSYPSAKIIGSSPSYDRINPNFTASFTPPNNKNTYISGFCTKATMTKPSHKISSSQDAELVLEHSKIDGTTFYVVIPIKFNGSKTTQIDNFLLNEDFYLDKDLVKTGKDMFCYQKTGNYYVFVFENPITINGSKQDLSDFSNKFNSIQTGTTKKGKKTSTYKNAFKVNNAQNFKEEIECEYSTTVDTNKDTTKSGLKAITYIAWTFATIVFVYGVMLFLQKSGDNRISYGIFLLGLILMITISVLLSKSDISTTKKINYGYALLWGLIMMILSIKNLKSNTVV